MATAVDEDVFCGAFVSPRDFILDVASDVGVIVECLFLS